MRLGRLATNLFTLKYQTKHFLYCEVTVMQDTEEKCWVSRVKFTGRKRPRGKAGPKIKEKKNSVKL